MDSTRQSFSQKLMLYILILVAVLVAGLSGVFLNYLLYAVKDAFTGVSTGFAYYLLRSHDISKAIHDRTVPQLEKEIAANMELQDKILYVALIDGAGRVALDTTGGDVTKIMQADHKNSWRISGERERVFYLRKVRLRDKTYDVANVMIPVFEKGRVWGGGAVGVSANYLFRDALPRAAAFIAFLFIFFAALSAVVFFLLIRLLFRPVRALIEGAEGIFEQNFETEVPVCGEDELGRLAEIFNRLISYLKDMISRLREQSLLDPATNCYRELFFRKQLTVELERARRFGDPLSAGWIALKMSDYANQELDPAFIAVARAWFADRLRECTRHIDILAWADQPPRFGVIFPKTNLEGLDVILNRLTDMMKKQGKSVPARPGIELFFSYGLVFYNPKPESPNISSDDFLRRADIALDHAEEKEMNQGEISSIEPVL